MATKLRPYAANLITICVTVAVALLLMEISLRRLDGYQLFKLELVSSSPAQTVSPDMMVQRGRDYAAKVVLDPSFRLDWFNSTPPVIDTTTKYPLPMDWVQAVAKANSSDPNFKVELKRLYNRNFVMSYCRHGSYPTFFERFRRYPGFLYTFPAPDDSLRPEFRQVPHGWDAGPGTFNNFGFRGPDIPFRKGPQTIRIAVLGASTTEGGWPWTFPDHVAQMLRLWAKSSELNLQFDVVNAGRSGVNSTTMAQIMRYEVGPLRPDIVIWYGGTETIQHIADAVRILQPGYTKTSRTAQLAQPASFRLGRYSAIARRLRQLVIRPHRAEPPKPPHQLPYNFSATPDVDAKDLPPKAKMLVADIRSAAASAKKIGAEFFVASTVLLARKGLLIDPVRQQPIWRGLNGEFFPMTYAEIQAAIEYENRLVHNLSIKDHLQYIEIYKHFPQNADLFRDPFHFDSDTGYRLQGWIIAQQLAPYILDAVRSGKLPRPSDADESEIAWVKVRPKRIDLNCRP